MGRLVKVADGKRDVVLPSGLRVQGGETALLSDAEYSTIDRGTLAMFSMDVPQYSGAGLLTPTTVKTSNYTASPGDFVPVDTTGGNVTITLPQAPADLSMVAVKQVAQGVSALVNVVTSGSDVINVSGGASSVELLLLDQGATFEYHATAGIWYIITDDLPLSALDGRYGAQLTFPISIGLGGTGSSTRNFAGLLKPTTVKNTTYSITPGDFVPVDVSAGSVTLSLPAAPADLTTVGAKMVRSGGSNTVTINCGGGDVFNIAGGATSITLKLAAQAVILQYSSAAGIWYIFGDDLPLSQLDLRYLMQSSLPLSIANGGTGSNVRTWAGLLTPTAVKTSNYTASPGDFVPVDTTSGSITITLPTTPADLTVVAIKQITQGTGNTVSYACGGADVINKAGTTSGTLTLLNQAVILQYSSALGVWYVCADDLPLGQLDLRYIRTSLFEFIAPSGDTTGATDATAFQNAATAGQIGILESGGTYYVNRPTVFPPGTGLVSMGQSLQYYGGSITMPLTGAVIKMPTSGPGFAGITLNGQAISAPLAVVDQNLGGYSTGSSGQIFRGITLDGRGSPASTNGIEAWGPVWGVALESVGVYGFTGDGVHTNKTTSPTPVTTTVDTPSNGGQISNIATWGSGFGGNGVLAAGTNPITAGFLPAGTLLVATSTTTATITYTGLTSSSFTGCAYVSGSSSGLVSTGGSITQSVDTTHFPDLWRVSGCHFAANGGNGFSSISLSDSYFIASEATGNTLNGWSISGDNAKWIGCKAEFNHGTAGWNFTISSGATKGHAVQMVGCGTDGNVGHGIQVTGWGPLILTNVQLMGDGTGGNTNAGLNIAANANTHVTCTNVHVLSRSNGSALAAFPNNGIQASGTGTYELTLENCEIYAGGVSGGAAINCTGSGTVQNGPSVLTGTGDWTGTNTSLPLTTAWLGALAPGGLTISRAAPSGTFGSLLDLINTTAGPTVSPVGIVAAGAGDKVFGLRVSGDTQSRLTFDSNGKLSWGPGGSTTQDTFLYRPAGIANALKTDGTLNAVSGVQNNGNPLGFGGTFGTGADGVLVFDGTTTILGMAPSGNKYTMTRDIHATSITVNSGVTLYTGGIYRVFCQGAVAGPGTISAAGNNASGATAGVVQGAGSLLGGRAGGAGGTSNGGGATGGNATLGGSGGTGGSVTGGGAGGAGGNAANVTTATAVANTLKNPAGLLAGVACITGNTIQLAAAAGGGGGGADGANAGGGGGGGGGTLAIFAYSITNITLTAQGGNGANGTAGNAGGGGPGSGGLIVAYTLSAWTSVTTVVTAGSAGTSPGTGGSGTGGNAGSVLNQVLS